MQRGLYFCGGQCADELGWMTSRLSVNHRRKPLIQLAKNYAGLIPKICEYDPSDEPSKSVGQARRSARPRWPRKRRHDVRRAGSDHRKQDRRIGNPRLVSPRNPSILGGSLKWDAVVDRQAPIFDIGGNGFRPLAHLLHSLCIDLLWSSHRHFLYALRCPTCPDSGSNALFNPRQEPDH